LAAIEAGVLGAVSPAKLAELPAVAIRAPVVAPQASQPWATKWLPNGVSLRTAALWLVLVAGVLVLAGVAYGLLRQINAPR
jgi:glucose/arabinose dehydrogenase